MLKRIVELFSIVRASNFVTISRVSVSKAEDLLTSNNFFLIFIFTNIETYRRRRLRITTKFFESLKRRFNEIIVINLELNVREKDTFSRYSLKILEIEQRLSYRISFNTILAYISKKALFISSMNFLDF